MCAELRVLLMFDWEGQWGNGYQSWRGHGGGGTAGDRGGFSVSLLSQWLHLQDDNTHFCYHILKHEEETTSKFCRKVT